MPYVRGQKRIMRKPIKKAGGVILPKTNPKATNRDFRFKQMSPYGVKPEPFPRVLYTRMKYIDQGNFDIPFINNSRGFTYRTNSINNPLYTAGGYTVVGHNTMSTIYSRYLVTGCKLYVSFNNPTEDGVRCGVRIRTQQADTAIGVTTKNTFEQPMTYVAGLNNTGSQKKDFKFFIRPWTQLGISKLEYFANTNKYSAPMNSDPIVPSYIDVFALNQSVINTTIDYVVKIVYYVQLYDRMPLISSLNA